MIMSMKPARYEDDKDVHDDDANDDDGDGARSSRPARKSGAPRSSSQGSRCQFWASTSPTWPSSPCSGERPERGLTEP